MNRECGLLIDGVGKHAQHQHNGIHQFHQEGYRQPPVGAVKAGREPGVTGCNGEAKSENPQESLKKECVLRDAELIVCNCIGRLRQCHERSLMHSPGIGSVAAQHRRRVQVEAQGQRQVALLIRRRQHKDQRPGPEGIDFSIWLKVSQSPQQLTVCIQLVGIIDVVRHL